MFFIKKFPAYVNGRKNPTKMSFVVLQRNDSIEKAVQEYIAKGETKVSLKKVTKIEKKRFNPTITPQRGVDANVNRLQSRFNALKEDTDAILRSDPPSFDDPMLESDPPTIKTEPDFEPYAIPSTFPTSFEIVAPDVIPSTWPTSFQIGAPEMSNLVDGASSSRSFVFHPSKTSKSESPPDPSLKPSSIPDLSPSLVSDVSPRHDKPECSNSLSQEASNMPDVKIDLDKLPETSQPVNQSTSQSVNQSTQNLIQTALASARGVVLQYELMSMYLANTSDNANTTAATSQVDSSVISSS